MSFKDPPDYLDALAIAEWLRLMPFLVEREFDKDEYLMPFTVYCQAVSQYQQALEDINTNGLTVAGRADTVVKNPSFITLREACERISQASKQFGFTPGDLKELKKEHKENEATPDWAKNL